MDELERFAKEFLMNAPVCGHVPLHGAVSKIEDVTSVLVFRHKQFQVQLFIVPPNYIIPAHKHPNVDSFEVYMGGQIRFTRNGKTEIDGIDSSPTPDGCSPARGQIIRIHPNDLHGGVFGEAGGVFMSIQHWQNDVEPHCVAADYSGATMGPNHFALVRAGHPIEKRQDELKAEDAYDALHLA